MPPRQLDTDSVNGSTSRVTDEYERREQLSGQPRGLELDGQVEHCHQQVCFLNFLDLTFVDNGLQERCWGTSI